MSVKRKPQTMVFGQKLRRFDQISFRTHNSSLEGATELKCGPFCSSFHALAGDMAFGQNRNFQILAENHGL